MAVVVPIVVMIVMGLAEVLVEVDCFTRVPLAPESLIGFGKTHLLMLLQPR